MSKELATTSDKGGIVKYDATNNPFLAAASGVGDFFGSRLSFDGNTGQILIGAKDDENEMKHGSVLVANLIAAEMGALCWVGGQLVDEVTFPIASGRELPILADLPDHGPYEKDEDGMEEGWQHVYRFQLYHEKDKEGFTFATSSKSGIRGVKKLLKAFGSKFPLKIGADGQYQYPVIEFTADSFKIKDKPKLGKKWAPVFNIIDWIDAEEALPYFATAASGDDEDDYDDEPETKSRGRSRDADSGEKETKTRGRGRGRAADSGEKEEKTSSRGRGRGRAADSGEKEEKSSGRGRRAAEDSGEKEEKSSGRGRSRDDDSGEKETRRSRRDEDSGEKESTRSRRRSDDSGEKEEESSRNRSRRGADSGDKEETAGRRTRVRHADPQDGDDDVDENVERRTSARARRGRG